jgi:hypothetical protein
MTSDLSDQDRLVALTRERDRENEKLGRLLNATKSASSLMEWDKLNRLSKELEAQRKRVKELMDAIDLLTPFHGSR